MQIHESSRAREIVLANPGSLQDPSDSPEEEADAGPRNGIHLAVLAEPVAPAQPPEQPPQQGTRPSNLTPARTGIIMVSLCAAVFIAALDVTIITTSLPAISAHFGPSEAGDAYTWIGAAFNLAHSASTPLLGRLSDVWGRKPVLQTAIAVFFAGSLICAVGDSLAVFVAGRAIQGVGVAGVLTMVNVVVGDLFSLRDRGLYYGLLSVVWAFAAGLGPVLGGVFAQKLTCVCQPWPIRYHGSLLTLVRHDEDGDGAST